MKLYILLVAAALSLDAKKQPVYDESNSEEVPEHAWDHDLFSKNRWCISSHTEFLFWTATEGATSYALKMNQPPWDTAGNNAAIGDFYNSTYSGEPGFRVGASYFYAKHLWEVWLQYTRFTGRGSNRVFAPTEPSEYLDSLWETFVEPNHLAEASSYIHLNYNVADFVFDRRFQPNPHLRLRLMVGVTGAWISQLQSVTYLAATTDLSSFVRNEWKFGGAGMRFGLMADWYWYKNFYMTFKGTVAGLLGPYRNRSYQTTQMAASGTSNTTIPLRNSSYTDHRSALNLQIIVGPSYQKSHPKWRIEFFNGFEANFWGNLQEVFISTYSSPQGAKNISINSSILNLFGLTSRLTIDY